MDKPISLSMKDYLIRILAVKLMTSEKTIETVINHQFQSANEALLNNKTIEISGFGKFIFNDKKALKKMSKYKDIQRAYQRHLENPELSENKRRVTELKLQSITEAINALKPKITDEPVVADIWGMEKQAPAPKGPKASDWKDKQGKARHMWQMSPSFQAP